MDMETTPKSSEEILGQSSLIFEDIYRFKFDIKKFLAYLGPGFLMSNAFLDPGNIAGDLDTGIKGGYSLIWVLLWATIIGVCYQSMAVRIGVVT